jgi:hypothetical protein
MSTAEYSNLEMRRFSAQGMETHGITGITHPSEGKYFPDFNYHTGELNILHGL